MVMSELDPGQVLRSAFDPNSGGLKIREVASSLVPSEFDYIELTYVTVGNGVGEIETVTYKMGGSGGSTVAVLTLAYDANDKLSSITKS